MKQIRPLRDRLVVTLVGAEAKTAGGIIIPESSKDREKKGKVVKIGPLVNKDKNDEQIHEGDIILFGQFSGTELEIDGVDYRIMTRDEVIAVL